MDIKDKFLEKSRTLKELKSQVLTLEKETQLLQKKYHKHLLDSKIAEKEAECESLIGGLNILTIRNILAQKNDASSIKLLNVPIVTTGSGPWKEEEFDQFLASKDFDLYELPSPTIEILILGKSDVYADSLIEQIDLAIYENPRLKIYTQELFSCWLITGVDPIENWTEEDLLESIADHTTLNYLLENYADFQWPNIAESNLKVWGDVEEIDSSEWQVESVLHRVGYSVTDGKLTITERRKCLNNAFNNDLTSFRLDYNSNRKWGLPRSSQRLYAMASLISWLIRFQGVNKPLAKEKWKDDLDWLKENYFDKRMSFKWPYLSKNQSSVSLDRAKLKEAGTWPFPNGSRP
jgi:hypothetical protein